MRALRTAVALGAASACGIAWAAGLGGAAQTVRASDVTPASLDSTVLATLNEETQDGFNPKTNGLYINWSSVDPTQVNFTNHDVTRHDPLTDLRDLDNMERYEQVNSGDTSQQSAIQRMYPIVAAEFKNSTSNVGWVYWEFLDLAQLTGDSGWTADATSMATAFSKEIDPATGVVHEKLSDNNNSCSDGYRVDATLERALMLVDAGKRFGELDLDPAGVSGVLGGPRHRPRSHLRPVQPRGLQGKDLRPRGEDRGAGRRGARRHPRRRVRR